MLSRVRKLRQALEQACVPTAHPEGFYFPPEEAGKLGLSPEVSVML